MPGQQQRPQQMPGQQQRPQQMPGQQQRPQQMPGQQQKLSATANATSKQDPVQQDSTGGIEQTIKNLFDNYTYEFSLLLLLFFAQ